MIGPSVELQMMNCSLLAGERVQEAQFANLERGSVAHALCFKSKASKLRSGFFQVPRPVAMAFSLLICLF